MAQLLKPVGRASVSVLLTVTIVVPVALFCEALLGF